MAVKTRKAAIKAQGGGLNRLAGKKVCLSGKFAYGEQAQLEALSELQGGKVVKDPDSATDYLVVPDGGPGKTIQQKVLSLNAKGATIQVINEEDFKKLIDPSEADVVAVLRQGPKAAAAFNQAIVEHYHTGMTARRRVVGENFDGLDLSGFNLFSIDFDGCSFKNCNLGSANFGNANNCDFSGAKSDGIHARVGEIKRSVFKKAQMPGLSITEPFDAADFSEADLSEAGFHAVYMSGRTKSAISPIFRKTTLSKANFNDVSLDSPDFEGANLTGSSFSSCKLQNANFAKATVRNAGFVDCKLSNADFRNADLRGASFANSDLGGSRFDGADLTSCNLRGAKITGIDFSRTKGYSASAVSQGAVGPALTELDTLGAASRRIQFSFRVRSDEKDEGEEVSIDTNGLKYGWGIQTPFNAGMSYHRSKVTTISDAMLMLANLAGHRHVRYDTVEVQSTKSPKGGKELRELVLKGIREAFAQPLPATEELEAATKAWRDKDREKNAAARKERAQEKAKEEKAKKREVAKIEKKIEKAVGKVSDIATFLKALELRAEEAKIKKATSMLKAEKFQLFKDIGESHLYGVVKSQTDPDLVYACRIDSTGQYACCTQNLNICGGLRGSICKHLLVLIIGLVKAGELDPTDIDRWVSKTHNVKPELNKETMGEIFIRYKGAEAGEVDWRPTETMPEDYYAL